MVAERGKKSGAKARVMAGTLNCSAAAAALRAPECRIPSPESRSGYRREGRRSLRLTAARARGCVLFGGESRVVRHGSGRAAAKPLAARDRECSAGVALALLVPLLRRAPQAGHGGRSSRRQRSSEGAGHEEKAERPEPRAVSLEEARAYLEHAGGDGSRQRTPLPGTETAWMARMLAPDDAEIHHALFCLAEHAASAPRASTRCASS